MNFKKLMNVADNNKFVAQSEATVKRYSTVLAPPKKPPKSNVKSDAIRKFLARKEEEERQRSLQEQKKKEELLCLRSQNTKNSKKAKIMASRTKDNDFSKIRMTDDEMVANKEREAKILRMSLNDTVQRMKVRIDMEEKEKLLPHKRKRKPKQDNAQELGIDDDSPYVEDNSASISRELQSRSNRGFSSKDADRKNKPKLPRANAPPVNFEELLKMAAAKQYQPIEIEEVQVTNTDERPLTKKERAVLLAEEARLRRKLSSNTEENLNSSKSDPHRGKIKHNILNGKNADHINVVQKLSVKFSKSNGDLPSIGDRERNAPPTNNFHIPKRNSNGSTEALKSLENKNPRHFSSKSAGVENSMSRQNSTKGNFHKKAIEKNSFERRLQSHEESPPRPKAISKTSERCVGLQNVQKGQAPNAKKLHPSEKSLSQRKVPHSNQQQNTPFPRSNSMGNISGVKKPFQNSVNAVNMQKERNSLPSNVKSKNNTSHLKSVTECRLNKDAHENVGKSTTKGIALSKSTVSQNKLSSSVRLTDRNSKMSNSSAISSNRGVPSSAFHKDPVNFTKVPGKISNTRTIVGSASLGHDVTQRSMPSDIRLKNGGRLPFQSQDRMQNVKRNVEHPFAKGAQVTKPSFQKQTTPVHKLNTKSEISKKPPIPSTQYPPSSGKLPPSRPPPSRPPPSRPPSSRPPPSSAMLPPSRPLKSSKMLSPTGPPRPSAMLPPIRPPIKSSYPRNPYLDPPRRLLESRRPQGMQMKRRIESDDDEEDEDDDMSDFIDDGNCDEQSADYSKYIKEIFKYDRSRYADDDDDDIMETSFAEQMKEETRSAKLGYLEDLEDIRKEEEEKKRKKKKMKK